MKLLGIIRFGFDVTDKLLIRFCINHILEKKWEYNETVHQLFIDSEKAYDSIREEILCNNFVECWLLMKLVRLLKMCLN
jgi:hypothetical protein